MAEIRISSDRGDHFELIVRSSFYFLIHIQNIGRIREFFAFCIDIWPTSNPRHWREWLYFDFWCSYSNQVECRIGPIHILLSWPELDPRKVERPPVVQGGAAE